MAIFQAEQGIFLAGGAEEIKISASQIAPVFGEGDIEVPVACVLNSAIVNAALPKESAVRYFSSRQSAAVWSAMVVCGGVISIGSSLAAHSWAVTSGLLIGAIVVWWLGYWVLSKNCYYISPAKVGFKDVFRAAEVQFDEVRSVTKNTNRDSITLTFVCDKRTVMMPVDPMDQSWLNAVKTELAKRGIPFSPTMFGLPVTQE
jgi:hypothetical protein